MWLIYLAQYGYAVTVIVSGVGLFFTSAIWKSLIHKKEIEKEE
jgi:hypothetical protein